jgi:CheY-like chemotaxis protein
MATPTNRRRHFRISVRGTALVYAPGDVVRCTIGNLSAGGTLVHPVAVDTSLRPGLTVEIELHLAGGTTICHTGEVVRCLGDSIAVTFTRPSAEIEDLIGDEVLAAVEASRAPRVLVVGRADDRRRRVATALTHAGYQPIETSTPLEAIDLIEGSRQHVTAAMVSEDPLTQTEGEELASFLAESHPDLRVAVVAGRPRAPTQPEIPVIAVDDRDELTGRVRAVVERTELQ